MRIIPAIDIIDGKCVRLTQGDYQQKKIYNTNPLEVAQEFEDAGIKYLHLVDLDGAKARRIVNTKVLESITNKTNLIVDFGGGIQTATDIKAAFDAGAMQVTVGTIAVKNPDLFLQWLNEYGNKKIILGADVKNKFVAVSGWLEQSELDIFKFLKGYAKMGVEYLISTDISKDGLLEGSAIELYKEILKQFPTLKLVASGGITSIEELRELQNIGCDGAIIGKAIYEKRINLKELTEFLISRTC